MEALKWEYDIIASEAVHRLRSVCGNQGDLYHQLEHLHTSDPVLDKFWQITRTIPPWVDWQQLGRGQTVCKRYAIPMLIGFAFQGFAGEIAAALGPAEVLVRTGGLSQRNIIGRVASTLRWLMEVTESPESLHADGPGFVSTIRVRLRHAAVRQRMLAIPNSHPAFLDTTLHGIPINTFDSILTLTFFCCNPIWIQLPQLGIILNENEAEDLVALFRYLAYLLGVPTEYFASAAMAKMTMKTIKDGKTPPSESSKKITRDFIAAFADKTPYNISRGFLQAGIRAMNPGPESGPKLSDEVLPPPQTPPPEAPKPLSNEEFLKQNPKPSKEKQEAYQKEFDAYQTWMNYKKDKNEVENMRRKHAEEPLFDGQDVLNKDEAVRDYMDEMALLLKTEADPEEKRHSYLYLCQLLDDNNYPDLRELCEHNTRRLLKWANGGYKEER
ncbi:hypothetical protein MBLNU13_g00012t2 [Cladosporium sp. NU13]